MEQGVWEGLRQDIGGLGMEEDETHWLMWKECVRGKKYFQQLKKKLLNPFDDLQKTDNKWLVCFWKKNKCFGGV